jgi:hypothetical protein
MASFSSGLVFTLEALFIILTSVYMFRISLFGSQNQTDTGRQLLDIPSKDADTHTYRNNESGKRRRLLPEFMDVCRSSIGV